ncbi:MAG TPA: hypothetical protein VFZ21_31890 [Gemmatimonadaceae bacterium]|nr:hypothetical protein [Gemmatimonadaceae bacterium]
MPITRVRDALPSDVDVTLDWLLAKARRRAIPTPAIFVDALSALDARSSIEH